MKNQNHLLKTGIILIILPFLFAQIFYPVLSGPLTSGSFILVIVMFLSFLIGILLLVIIFIKKLVKHLKRKSNGNKNIFHNYLLKIGLSLIVFGFFIELIQRLEIILFNNFDTPLFIGKFHVIPIVTKKSSWFIGGIILVIYLIQKLAKSKKEQT